MTKYVDDIGLEHFFDNIKDLTRGPSYQQVASYLNAHPESLNDPVADYLDENPTATIPNESITADKLASNSVTSEKIADGAVTTNDLANGAVTSTKIADGTIATDDLADSSVTTAKIADSAVTTAKIANGAVTANKLANDAIPTMSATTAGIAKVGAGLAMNNGAVELNADTTGISGAVEAWLDAHPEATTTVEDGAITTAKLADGAVTTEKLAEGSIIFNGHHAYMGISHYLKPLTGTFSTLTLGRWVDPNGSTATVTNAKRAVSGSLNTTTRRAYTITDSSYMFQAIAYKDSTANTANRLGWIEDGWLSSGDILYIPDKMNGQNVAAIQLQFKRVDDADLTEADGTAIKAATQFFRTTDDELTSAGIPADGKAAGDGISALDTRLALVETQMPYISALNARLALVETQMPYSSSDDVSLVDTAAGVTSLFDALVSENSAIVSKSTLTSGEVTLPEYTFTVGNYNTAGNRSHDAEITKPTILLCAGVHGYERSSVMSLYSTCKALIENERMGSKVLQRFTIKVVPIVCAWGYDNNSRINEDGVNINRNFDSSSWEQTNTGTDYSGPSAGSEDETQAVQTWIDANTDAVLYVDWHNSNFTSEISCSLMVATDSDAQATKMAFLLAMNDIIPHWRDVRDIPSSSIFAYTGRSTASGSSISYATDKGIRAMTFETSWNVASSGKHSAFTIGTGAEACCCMLAGMADFLTGR